MEIVQYLAKGMWDQILRDPTKAFPLIGTLATVLGICITFIVAVQQINNGITARKNSDIASVLSRNAELNRRILESKYLQAPAALFVKFNPDKAKDFAADTLSPQDREQYFIATRVYFIELTKILFQIWWVDGRRDKLSRDLDGWEKIAIAIYDEIYDRGHIGKPEWYSESCKKVRDYFEEGRFYSSRFIRWLKKRGTIEKRRAAPVETAPPIIEEKPNISAVAQKASGEIAPPDPPAQPPS